MGRGEGGKGGREEWGKKGEPKGGGRWEVGMIQDRSMVAVSVTVVPALRASGLF